MPIDPRNIIPGRQPHSPARYAAVKPFVAGAPSVPDSWSGPVGFKPEADYNLTLPTCSIAGLLNSARLTYLRRTGADLAYDTTAALRVYAAICGCAPTEVAIAATDGLVLLDVLEYIQRNGFDIGAQVPLVLRDFSRIEITDLSAARRAIVTCDCAYVGLDIYEADENGQPLTDGTANAGALVGGHCDPPFAFTPAGFTTATWGMEMPCSDLWLQSRIREAYALDWAFAVAA